MHKQCKFVCCVFHLTNPQIASVWDFKQAIKTLAGVTVDQLIAFELLWTPQVNPWFQNMHRAGAVAACLASRSTPLPRLLSTGQWRLVLQGRASCGLSNHADAVLIVAAAARRPAPALAYTRI
jgi:hypothetical protein